MLNSINQMILMIFDIFSCYMKFYFQIKKICNTHQPLYVFKISKGVLSRHRTKHLIKLLCFYFKMLSKKNKNCFESTMGWVMFFKIQYLYIFSFPCVWFEISSYFSTLKLYSEVLLGMSYEQR